MSAEGRTLEQEVASAAAAKGAEMMTLTAIHRCDRCGAQAYLRAWKAEGQLEMLFCGHHAKEHTPKLVETGWLIHDETSKLTGEVAGVSSVV